MKTRTLANLSRWPEHKVETLTRALKGLPPARDLSEAFEITRSLPHGHVAAVLGTARRLGIEELIDPAPSRRRDLATASREAHSRYKNRPTPVLPARRKPSQEAMEAARRNAQSLRSGPRHRSGGVADPTSRGRVGCGAAHGTEACLGCGWFHARGHYMGDRRKFGRAFRQARRHQALNGSYVGWASPIPGRAPNRHSGNPQTCRTDATN